ncbi:MAG: hypothetical protein U0441_22910 [Polyangiaceae bacterium]
MTQTSQGAGSEAHVVHEQANHVRSLLDELDRLAPPSDRAPALPRDDSGRTLESLANLARRMMAAVASMTPPPPAVAAHVSGEAE